MSEPIAKRQRTGVRPMQIKNPNIAELKTDFYYHLGLNSSMPIKDMFGDTKAVIMGGSASRMQIIAHRLTEEFPEHAPVLGTKLAPIGKTERFTMFKVGPVISVSHGMGKPSMSILLHEITKLLAASECTDVVFIRVGTSGGVGVESGVCVIATSTLNEVLEPYFQNATAGKMHKYPASLDEKLAQEIMACKPDGIEAVHGITMGTDDFYEAQGRLDGAICEHTESEKMDFLRKAHEKGVRNIEMESDCFAAFTHRLGIRAAVVCTSLLNRLNGDQVDGTKEDLAQWAMNAINLVLAFIKKHVADCTA